MRQERSLGRLIALESAIAVCYFVAGKLSLRLAFVHASASPVWPPTGIALAGVLLFGTRVWPAIFLGAFLVNVTTAGTVATSLGIALGNTLEAVLGAYLVQRYANGLRAFERAADAFKFALLSGFLSTTVSATLGVTSLSLGGYARWADYPLIWSTWWLGDLSGDLVAAPPIILWSRLRLRGWSRAHLLEAGLLLLALVLVGAIVFGGVIAPIRNHPIAFLCIPVLVWATFRFGPTGVASAVIVLSSIAVWGTVRGLGPFARASPNESLLLLQSFLAIVSVSLMPVAALVWQARSIFEERERLLEEKVAILESAGEGIYGVDLQGNCIFVNHAAADLLGYAPEDLIGRNMHEAVHYRRADGSPYPTEECPLYRTLRTAQGIRSRDEPFFRRDGSSFPADYSAFPIMVEGRPAGIVVTIADTSGRREAEERREEFLRREKELRREAEAALAMLRKVQRVTDEALSPLGLGELLRELLVRVREALGGDTATVLLLDPEGRALAPIASDGLAEEIDEDVRVPIGRGIAGRIAATEAGVIIPDLSSVEVISPHLRGTVRSLLGAPLKVDGRVIGVIHVGSVSARAFGENDLQLLRLVAHRAALAIERARLHDAERDAREKAEAASRAKDEFLAMLGHELRNPLAAISSAVYILQQASPGQGPVAQAGGILSRQVEHLAHLVDDLLDVARVTAGTIVLERRPLDLSASVAASVSGLRLAGRLDGHQLTVQAEPVWVSGDPTRLEQVATNLLANAIRYTPAGGRIRISTRRQDGEAVLRVEDSGIGISSEALPHVFDLFFQADRGLDRRQGGLGIGLTLVRRLVELHGGTVDVGSEGPGRGSVFTVRLPTIAAPSASESARGARSRVKAPRRILLVEDNDDTRESLRIYLEMAGHAVTCAADGPSGLQAAAAARPEVALIDIGLPGLDGYEIARRIRADPRYAEVTLVALTGYGQMEDRRRAEEAGFDAHLVKPVEHEKLEEMLLVPDRRSVRRDEASSR